MIPDWIGAYLFNASAIGAKQFVVQEAAEMIVSEAFNAVSYTHLPVPVCNPLMARIWSCPV